MQNQAPLIDKDFGLSQLSGNEALLTKMIFKFKVEFSQVPNEVKSLIDEGNIRDAKMKVHTTKGISGNLGLSAIFECSKKLDNELKLQVINDDTLNEFNELMASTCSAIEDMGDASTASEQGVPSSSEYKSKLIAKLNAQEFITDSELDDWLPRINVNDAISTEIRTAIDALDYKTALTLING